AKRFGSKDSVTILGSLARFSLDFEEVSFLEIQSNRLLEYGFVPQVIMGVHVLGKDPCLSQIVRSLGCAEFHHHISRISIAGNLESHARELGREAGNIKRATDH